MLFFDKRNIAFMLTVFCMTVFSFCFSCENAYAAKSKTSSAVSCAKITPIDFEKTEKMSALDLLNLILEQEKALSAVFEKSKNTQNNDKLFEIFYNNVSDSVFIIHGKFEYFNREVADDENVNRMSIGGIEFMSANKDDMYSIIKPATGLFTYQTNLAFDSFKMNDKYINEKFAKSLSKPWKAYLALSAKNTEPCAADIEGYNIDRKTAGEWIISWNEFLLQYPGFVKNDNIKEVIDYLTEQFEEGPYETYDEKTGKLLPGVKSDFENFLSKADKNSDAYKSVKGLYDALKQDGFKKSANYYNYIGDSGLGDDIVEIENEEE